MEHRCLADGAVDLVGEGLGSIEWDEVGLHRHVAPTGGVGDVLVAHPSMGSVLGFSG